MWLIAKQKTNAFVYGGMSLWQRTQYLWMNSCNRARGEDTVTPREEGKRWQFWHLFLVVLTESKMWQFRHEWVDLFFEVLTESHAKKVEPEVKQLFSCVRFPNRRFLKYSIPQLSPVVRGFQSWRKLMDSFLKTRWWHHPCCRKLLPKENSLLQNSFCWTGGEVQAETQGLRGRVGQGDCLVQAGVLQPF